MKYGRHRHCQWLDRSPPAHGSKSAHVWDFSKILSVRSAENGYLARFRPGEGKCCPVIPGITLHAILSI